MSISPHYLFLHTSLYYFPRKLQVKFFHAFVEFFRGKIQGILCKKIIPCVLTGEIIFVFSCERISFFSSVCAHIRREPTYLKPQIFRLLFLLNALVFTVHWFLPHFSFSNLKVFCRPPSALYVYVGPSPFLSVLLLEATLIMLVHLLTYSPASRQLLPSTFSISSNRPASVSHQSVSCSSSLSSTYRDFVNSPFASLADRLLITLYQAFASSWEGIIAFRTLLFFFVRSTYPYATLSALTDLLLSVHRSIFPFLLKILNTFCFVLSFLYLYYSKYFSFVKWFLKKFSRIFSIGRSKKRITIVVII